VINVDLCGPQYVEFEKTYLGTITIMALGHGSNFDTATAMCRHWKADFPDELVGRDGTTVYDRLTEDVDFGEEWQVDLSQDPDLFRDAGDPNCTYINGTDKIEPGIEEACKDVPEERGLKENCEFDVVTTVNSAWATQLAYVNPILDDPVSQSIEASGTDCADKGGRCVWRCVTTENWCYEELCTGAAGFDETEGDVDENVIDGCACALPLEDRCVKESGTECADKGGECVWRCDSAENFCNEELCKGAEGFDESEGDPGEGVTDGCACAFPREACTRLRFFEGFMMHCQFRRRCRELCVMRLFGLWESFGFLYGAC
jgi:hypothetical protein